MGTRQVAHCILPNFFHCRLLRACFLMPYIKPITTIEYTLLDLKLQRASVLFAVVDDCILCINFQCIETVSLAFKSKSHSQSVTNFHCGLYRQLSRYLLARPIKRKVELKDLQTLHCINLKRLLNQSDRLEHDY